MADDWKKDANKRIADKKQGTTLKLDDGDSCVRILPDKKDLLPDGRLGPKGIRHSPCREFRKHFNVGPDKLSVMCGIDIDGNGSCWLDNVKLPELESSANPAKKLRAEEMRPKEQFLVNASKFDADTQKFGMSKPWYPSTGSGIPGRQGSSLAVRIHQKIASSKKDYVDPNKGYNINITKTGSGINTRYPDVEGDESPSKVPLEVLAAVKDLDSFIQLYDEEEMKAIYFGRPRGDDDDDELKSRPRSSKPKPKPVEDEEPDEDAPDADSEEEYASDTEEEPEEAVEEEEEEATEEPEEVAEEEVEPDEELEEPEPEPDEEEPEPAPAPKKKAPAPAKKVAPAPAKKVPPKPGRK